MDERQERVTRGSPRSLTVDTGAARITDAWFPPGASLAPRTEARPVFAVMMAGSFAPRSSTPRHSCEPGARWTEAASDVHANIVEEGGARVLVVEPDPARMNLPARFLRDLPNDITCVHDPAMLRDARRVATEMRSSDDLTPFVLDGLVLCMLAGALRAGRRRRTHEDVPCWLARARELIDGTPVADAGLHDIAAEAGVDPALLASEFRLHFHTSIGAYLRSRRLQWALDRLAGSTDSITTIALQAGFADQSHLTRACTAATGVPPAAFRRMCNDDVQERIRFQDMARHRM